MADRSPDTAPESVAVTPEQNPEAKLAQKVELDLDDAPFLKPEPEAAPEEVKAPVQEREEKQKEGPFGVPGKTRHKKILILAALGVGVGAVILAVVLTVMLRGAPPEPPPLPLLSVEGELPPPPSSMSSQVVRENGQQRFLINMAPFVILIDSTAGTRLLTFKFSVYADDPATQYAIQESDQRLRNAIYDFLSVRTTEELTASSSVNVLKDSLRDAMAAELPGSKVGEVFIEQIQIQ